MQLPSSKVKGAKMNQSNRNAAAHQDMDVLRGMAQWLWWTDFRSWTS